MECVVAVNGVEDMVIPKLWPELVLVLVHAVGGGGDGDVECLEAGDGVEVMVIPIPGLGVY